MGWGKIMSSCLSLCGSCSFSTNTEQHYSVIHEDCGDNLCDALRTLKKSTSERVVGLENHLQPQARHSLGVQGWRKAELGDISLAPFRILQLELESKKDKCFFKRSGQKTEECLWISFCIISTDSKLRPRGISEHIQRRFLSLFLFHMLSFLPQVVLDSKMLAQRCGSRLQLFQRKIILTGSSHLPICCQSLQLCHEAAFQFFLSSFPGSLR